MSTYYCHQCARRANLVGQAEVGELSGTYQLGKFVKHTLPSSGSLPVGVFNSADLETYRNYVVSSSASGSVEIDERKRTNVVWYAGKEIGATWVDGAPVVPNDTVKLVCSGDKLHAYSIASGPYGVARCSVCGDLILS